MGLRQTAQEAESIGSPTQFMRDYLQFVTYVTFSWEQCVLETLFGHVAPAALEQTNGNQLHRRRSFPMLLTRKCVKRYTTDINPSHSASC